MGLKAGRAGRAGRAEQLGFQSLAPSQCSHEALLCRGRECASQTEMAGKVRACSAPSHSQMHAIRESWGLRGREGIHLRVQSVSRVSRNVISVC